MQNLKYDIRPFNLSTDLTTLNQLRIEIEAVDKAGNNLDETILKEEILNWYGHDHTQDRWLIYSTDQPQTPIGYGWLFTQTSQKVVCYIAIHPAWRRQGVGTALFKTVRQRAIQKGATLLVGGARETLPEGKLFLQQLGFTAAGHNRFFESAPDLELAQPQLPDGFSIRPFSQINDVQLLVDVMDACYHDMWGHAQNTSGAVTAERIAKDMERQPDHHNPDSIFIAFASNDEPVGVCYGRYLHGECIVDSPGVVPEYRHLNLQTPLTLTTMHYFRDRYGRQPIQLYTFGDFETAVAQYKAIGFTLAPHNHLIEYILPIT